LNKKILIKIRNLVRENLYDLTRHANDEMAEDNLDIFDIENAIFTGKIVKVEKDDPRGTRYVIKGFAVDGITPVGVVGKFTETERYFVITVYDVTEKE
jgi:hypothetical protein